MRDNTDLVQLPDFSNPKSFPKLNFQSPCVFFVKQVIVVIGDKKFWFQALSIKFPGTTERHKFRSVPELSVFQK